MKKIFLKLLKQPITNSYLHNFSKKNLKKEFFYNLNVSFDTNLADNKNIHLPKTRHIFNIHDLGI